MPSFSSQKPTAHGWGEISQGIWIDDLASTGVPGRCVSLEITESVLIENLESTARSLKRIQDYGVEIAVDDFGTGYSSMAYLKELPARTLKIDRKFVQGVPDNAADCRILRAMIVFAKSLAEGVETRDQARICRDYGADLLQGYLFSKSLPLNKQAHSQTQCRALSHTILHDYCDSPIMPPH